MSKSVINGNYVHCHVCPLKDLCLVGKPEISYLHQHPKSDADYNFAEMAQVTANCPLRRILDV